MCKRSFTSHVFRELPTRVDTPSPSITYDAATHVQLGILHIRFKRLWSALSHNKNVASGLIDVLVQLNTSDSLSGVCGFVSRRGQSSIIGQPHLFG